jgi:hypothetical protein
MKHVGYDEEKTAARMRQIEAGEGVEELSVVGP